MASSNTPLKTSLLTADAKSLRIRHTPELTDLEVSQLPSSAQTVESLRKAAKALRETNSPVAFPTETVYGLGADATRSAAVRGIYAAKNRPIDNPLIVHVCSLGQLRTLLEPVSSGNDPLPAIYQPLIQRFWPGPLTILLPVSPHSAQQLAPEVTAGLKTFGARMPSAPLALALIHESGLPLAAPSANASTRPSPTRAEHVLHDLDGRIEFILDGGSCSVGVESTVVDGLCTPPAVLRPGGVSLEEIRRVPGWKSCIRGYKDYAEGDDDTSKDDPNGQMSTNGVNEAPRAPGMKYKHYSPTAKVALVKSGVAGPGDLAQLVDVAVREGGHKTVGILRAKQWPPLLLPSDDVEVGKALNGVVQSPEVAGPDALQFSQKTFQLRDSGLSYTVYDAQLGVTATEMARNLFHALRELDLLRIDIVFVEGLDDAGGDEAAAVMNRLGKAAEIKINALPWRP